MRFSVTSLAVIASSTAIAGTTIPASDSLGEPVSAAFMDTALPGMCGDWAEVDVDRDVHNINDTQIFLDAMDGDGSNFTEKVTARLSPIDVALHKPDCDAQGNFPGGAEWPTVSRTGQAVTRLQGVLNVTGAPGEAVQWTLGAIGNDTVRVTVGGVQVWHFGWADGDWKHFDHFTFEQPGAYPITVEWTTNHICSIDPLEIVMAPGHVDGFDDVSCDDFGGLSASCAPLGPTGAPFAPLDGTHLIAAQPVDSDADGLFDWEEGGFCAGDGPSIDGDDIPDALDPDDDNDGLPTSEELDLGTDPLDGDTDNDGLSDADEVRGYGPDLVTTNPTLADTDGDGLLDGLEQGLTVAHPDTDGAFQPDTDPQSTTDPNNPDSDNDQLSDGDEDANKDGAAVFTIGGSGTDGSGETDPNNSDTDGDTLPDGDEALRQEPTSPLDTDSDDGGVDDGTELTVDLTNPNDGVDDNLDTDNDGLINGFEETVSMTDPLVADSDGDGLTDGEEVNGTGLLTDWEPTNPNDVDTDGDGIDDGVEAGVDGRDADPSSTTDPNNPDTDNDTIPDGVEDANQDGETVNSIGGLGSDGSGETDPNNDDTDGDRLLDGQELNGQDGTPGTADDTNPLDTDSDDGGVQDGVEVIDDMTDPNTPEDDTADMDGDGLSDWYEENVSGTFPEVADSDGDGINDGDEVRGTGPLTDWAPTDPLLLDSDDDGVDDGVEAGVNGYDEDPRSTTDPNQSDTDDDGLLDGEEDVDGNGAVDNTIGDTGTDGSGETDPNNDDTDGDRLLDGEEVLGMDGEPETGDETSPVDSDSDDGSVDDGEEVLDNETDPNDPSDDVVDVDSDTDTDTEIDSDTEDTGLDNAEDTGDGRFVGGGNASCGCSSSGTAGWVWLGLPLAFVLRRRRKMQ